MPVTSGTAGSPRVPSSALASAHGWFNVLGGAWPLVHMRSFEAVLGPKADRWLVRTVAGLMIVNGWVQIRAGQDPGGSSHARRIGVGTALTLGAIDLAYAIPGRISRLYLVDALLEGAWIAAWVRATPERSRR